jgi:hypothetical protein
MLVGKKRSQPWINKSRNTLKCLLLYTEPLVLNPLAIMTLAIEQINFLKSVQSIEGRWGPMRMLVDSESY